ncbi:MAG: NAD(P)-dependent oxidoreductase [Nanoarchaeota archaeon]
MKSILITGGSGLVGSNVAKFFNNKGYKIFTVDLKESSFNNHIVCDLSKKENLVKLPEKVDYVFHFAAHVDEKDENKEYLLRNNVLSTLNVLEYALKNKVEKVVYSSSSAVYGKTEEYPIKEDFSKKPQSIYGISKYFGEELCNLYRKRGLQIISFRLGYVLAPVIPERYFIYRIMKKLNNNECITITNGVKNSMSFVDVEDIGAFCEEGLNKDLTGNFNLTGQREVNSKEVIDLLVKMFKEYSGEIKEEENNSIMRNCFSNERLYSTFNQRYRLGIEDSLNRIVASFKDGLTE